MRYYNTKVIITLILPTICAVLFAKIIGYSIFSITIGIAVGMLCILIFRL